VKNHQGGPWIQLVIVLATALLLAVIFFIIARAAQAAQVSKQLTVHWTYPETDQAAITGFRLYNQAGDIVIADIPPAARQASAVYTYEDSAIQALHLVAIGRDGSVSTPSNIFLIPPRPTIIQGVGKITVELESVEVGP
jgi:hypothetical protein